MTGSRKRIAVAWIAETVSVALLTSCGLLGRDDSDAKLEKGKPLDLAEFTPEATLDLNWRTRIGKGLGKKYIALAPRIVGDLVVAADAYGIVEARNRLNGRVEWSARVGRPRSKGFLQVRDRADTSFVSGGLGAGEGMVVLGTTRGEVIALSAADGKELWRTRVTSEVLAAPSVRSEVVAVQTADGKLHVLDVKDGAPRWAYDSQVAPLTLRGTAAPVILDGVIYAGFSNGILAAFDISTGAAFWEQRIALPEGTSEIDRLVDVDGTPLIFGPMVIASSYQGVTKAISRANGQVLWELDLSSHISPKTGLRQVYIVANDGVLKAVDAELAEVNWEVETLINRELTEPIVFGNYLAVGDHLGYVHILAQSDGRFVARRKMREGVRSPIAYQEGDLYVLANNGYLYSYSVERD
ncbi:MAG: outer membrane protein assembly factor BamB [Pseudomonadales bacterium]|nr:outer membrane protein assembly factor BamB [Pseudomonadales bacterium]